MILKRAFGCFFALALGCGFLNAQDEPKIAHTNRSATVVPYRAGPTSLKQIFSSFGPSATNAYNATTGYYVLGPNNSVGLGEQWIAIPFTPQKNSHATLLQAGIGWISGAEIVDIGLYSDSGGTVGTLLASGAATKMPAFGACCSAANVTIPATALTAGMQYWLVATTDDTNAPDFTGVFMASNGSTIAYDPALAGWFNFSGNVPAAAVHGTEP